MLRRFASRRCCVTGRSWWTTRQHGQVGMRAQRWCFPRARTGCGGLRTCRPRRRDDARRMSDFEIHDRQQHAQGRLAPRMLCRLLCVDPVDARQARAAAWSRTELISDARAPGPAGGQPCRAAASVGDSGPIGLDRRDHEGRSVALRGILVSRGASRVRSLCRCRGNPGGGSPARWVNVVDLGQTCDAGSNPWSLANSDQIISIAPAAIPTRHALVYS